MSRYVLMSVIAAVFFCAGHAGAKEVNLGTGENFPQKDLTVTCGQLSTDTPLALKDCQYREAFNSTCHYQTTYTFYPPQMAFVRTTCEKFDDYSNTCLKTSEIKIGH